MKTCLRQAGTCVAQLQSNLIEHLIRWFNFNCRLENITWSTVTTFAIRLQSLSLILERTLWWLRYWCWACISKRAGFRATNLSNIMKVLFHRVVTSCLWRKNISYLIIPFPYLRSRAVPSGFNCSWTSRRSVQKLVDKFEWVQTDLKLKYISSDVNLKKTCSLSLFEQC